MLHRNKHFHSVYYIFKTLNILLLCRAGRWMGTFYQTCTQVQGYFIKSYEKKNSITVNNSHLTDLNRPNVLRTKEPKIYYDNYSFFDMIFFSPLHPCLMQRQQHQGHSYYPNINTKLADACLYLSERGQVSGERA